MQKARSEAAMPGIRALSEPALDLSAVENERCGSAARARRLDFFFTEPIPVYQALIIIPG